MSLSPRRTPMSGDDAAPHAFHPSPSASVERRFVLQGSPRDLQKVHLQIGKEEMNRLKKHRETSILSVSTDHQSQGSVNFDTTATTEAESVQQRQESLSPRRTGSFHRETTSLSPVRNKRSEPFGAEPTGNYYLEGGVHEVLSIPSGETSEDGSHELGHVVLRNDFQRTASVEDVSVITEFTKEAGPSIMTELAREAAQSQQDRRLDPSPERKMKQNLPVSRAPVPTIYSGEEEGQPETPEQSYLTADPRGSAPSSSTSQSSSPKGHPAWFKGRRLEPDAATLAELALGTLDPPTARYSEPPDSVDGTDAHSSVSKHHLRKPDAPAASVRRNSRTRHRFGEVSWLEKLDSNLNVELVPHTEEPESYSTSLRSESDEDETPHIAMDPSITENRSASPTSQADMGIPCRDPSVDEYVLPIMSQDSAAEDNQSLPTLDPSGEDGDAAEEPLPQDPSAEESMLLPQLPMDPSEEDAVQNPEVQASNEHTKKPQSFGDSAPVVLPEPGDEPQASVEESLDINTLHDDESEPENESPFPADHVEQLLPWEKAESALHVEENSPSSPAAMLQKLLEEEKLDLDESEVLVPNFTGERVTEILTIETDEDEQLQNEASEINLGSEPMTNMTNQDSAPTGTPNAQEMPQTAGEFVGLGQFIIPDNSLVDETGENPDSAWAAQYAEYAAQYGRPESGVADMAGLRGLFCCGTYGNESDVLRPPGDYPTMPHHKAAVVHVMETIQEVDSNPSLYQESGTSELSPRSTRNVTSPTAARTTDQEPFPRVFSEEADGEGGRQDDDLADRRAEAFPEPQVDEADACKIEVGAISPTVDQFSVEVSESLSPRTKNGMNVPEGEPANHKVDATLENDVHSPKIPSGTSLTDQEVVFKEVLDDPAAVADKEVTKADIKETPLEETEGTLSDSPSPQDQGSQAEPAEGPESPREGFSKSDLEDATSMVQVQTNDSSQQPANQELAVPDLSELTSSTGVLNKPSSSLPSEDADEPQHSLLSDSFDRIMNADISFEADTDIKGTSNSGSGSGSVGDSTVFYDVDELSSSESTSQGPGTQFTEDSTLQEATNRACGIGNATQPKELGALRSKAQTISGACGNAEYLKMNILPTDDLDDRPTENQPLSPSNAELGLSFDFSSNLSFATGSSSLTAGCYPRDVASNSPLSRPIVTSDINTKANKPASPARKVNVHVRVIALQTSVRRMLAMKAYHRAVGSAIRLQSIARQLLAVLQFERVKEEHSKHLHAASIQASYRRLLALRRFKSVKWSVLVIQSDVRKHQALTEFQTKRNKIVEVQAMVRAWQSSKWFQHAKLAVVLIQAMCRGMLAFEKYQVSKLSAVTVQKNFRRMMISGNYQIARISALVIQTSGRRWLADCRFRAVKGAAVIMQTYRRGHVAERGFRLTKNATIFLQAVWRGFSARQKYSVFLLRSITSIQSVVRAWSLSRKFRLCRSAAVKVQTAWRANFSARSYASALRQVKTCQNLARIWIARQIACKRKQAAITIQAYERRRHARKALMAAKIVWQIETAFSDSANPATMPFNLWGQNRGGEPLAALLDSNSEETTVEQGMMKTHATGRGVELASSTQELENRFAPGCPPVVVLVNNPDGQEAALADSEDSSSQASDGKSSKKVSSRFLPKGCEGLVFAAQVSGSASMDESALPAQFSQLSGMTTQDDLSARDFSTATKDKSAFTSDQGQNTHSSQKTVIPTTCNRMLGCIGSMDNASAGEVSSSGDGDTQKKDVAEAASNKRGNLGGIRIVFADTVEYDSVGSPSKSVRKQTSAEKTEDLDTITEHKSGGASETGQANTESTQEDETLDSSVEPLRRTATVSSTHGGDLISDLLESVLDYVCLNPNGMMFFPQPPRRSTSMPQRPRANSDPSVQRPARERGSVHPGVRSPRSPRVPGRSDSASVGSPRVGMGSPRRRPRVGNPRHNKSPKSPIYYRTPTLPGQTEENTDLAENDQLFQLLANMLVEFFQTKVAFGRNQVVLEPEDRTQVELLLPGQKHVHFIAALRKRLASVPASPTTVLQRLILRCQDLGFDRDEPNNPILAARSIADKKIEFDLAPRERQTDNKGAAAATASVAEDDKAKTEQVDQIVAELREAKNMLAESENSETSLFWKNHVAALEARLSEINDLKQTSDAVSRKSPNTGYAPPTLSEQDQKPESQVPLQHRSREPAEEEAPMVDVISPADLPGGYHFEAEIEGQRFLATVPPGGVQQGETFTCVMRKLDSVAIDIPVGYWKDNMSNACHFGIFHASLWNSIFCPLIALAQIGQRIQLDFLGRVQHPESGHPYYSNRTMMFIITSFWLAVNVALFAGFHFKWTRGLEISLADYSALALINTAMVGFTIFVTQSTRYSLREKFMIREERCYDLEDLVCSTFCLPCVVGQMQRHTANYDEHEDVCCSETGLLGGVGVHEESNTQEKSAFIV